nr:MAG TPA: tail protein [Caudoviricetes sp.]
MTPILLSDPDTRIAFLKDATKCEVTEERNGAFEIVLEYPVSGKYFKDIAVERYIRAKPNCKGEPQLFRIYAVSKPIMGTVTVNGEHISYKLSHYPLKTLAPAKTTALVAMDRVLSAANQSIANPHKFTADFCDITTITQFGVEYCSARAALGGIRGSVLDCFGGEYEFDNFKIKLHKTRGSNNGVSIRYGKNMTDMKLTLSAENSYTGIFPYYVDDDKTQTLTEGTIHVENNSNIDERILMMDFSSYFDDGEEKNETTLRAHVNKYLEDNNINAVEGSMTVSMIDLSKSVHSGYVAALETVSLCDTVKVVNTLMDVSVTMKVIKTVYDAIGEKYVTLELGTPSSDFADVIKQTQRTANEAYKKASQMPDTSALEQKFQNDLNDMTKKITGASGGHVVLNPPENPQEFLILCDSDKLETAEKIYRFNSAGLAFSPYGYDGPYTSGLLGNDGKLIINNVTARSISADLIKAGTITSESGDLLVNLDNSRIISGATSPTRTVFEAGHLDLYYAGKYSGRIGQTEQNNIAIEGTDPDNPEGTPKTTDLAIINGGLYARDGGSFGGGGNFGGVLNTGQNEGNLYKMIEHCRKTQYYNTAYPFPAYMRLGIGAPSGPSMSCELRLNDISDDAMARIDVYKTLKEVKHSGTASNPGTLSWTDMGDLMIKFAYKYGKENSGNLIKLQNNEFDFLNNILYVKDIRIVTERTSEGRYHVSLKDKLGI